MTLQVSFEAFPATVERVLGGGEIYLTRYPTGALATAADPSRGTMVVAMSRTSLEEARDRLVQLGFDVYEGTWFSADVADLSREMEEAYVAGIAYKSAENRPGLWLDAFPALPTQVQVLRAMYDEMQQTGELSDVTFEEFVRLAEPTVVILSPSDLRSYITQKNSEPGGSSAPAKG